MKRKIWIVAGAVVGLGLIILGVAWALDSGYDSGFKFGYQKGFNDRVVPRLAEVRITNVSTELVVSKVVYDMEVTYVLRGKLLSASPSERSIVVGAGENDSLTVFFKDDAIMPVMTGGTGVPVAQPKLDMSKVGTFIGKDITVMAMLGRGEQRLEGTTFFSGNTSVKLR